MRLLHLPLLLIDIKEEYDSYRIVIKHRILDRYYSISELNPLSDHIDIEIPEPLPSDIVTLRHCAAQESTIEKIPVYCNCRDEKTWCSTRRCVCVKAEAKCSITYHDDKNQDNTSDCPNISSMTTRTQRDHRVRDQEDRETKRQRRTSAER